MQIAYLVGLPRTKQPTGVEIIADLNDVPYRCVHWDGSERLKPDAVWLIRWDTLETSVSDVREVAQANPLIQTLVAIMDLANMYPTASDDGFVPQVFSGGISSDTLLTEPAKRPETMVKAFELLRQLYTTIPRLEEYKYLFEQPLVHQRYMYLKNMHESPGERLDIVKRMLAADLEDKPAFIRLLLCAPIHE